MDTEKNLNKNERVKDSKSKKILIRIIAIVVAVIVFMIAASFAMNIYLERKAEKDAQKVHFDFAPANYDENIFEDQEYLALIEKGFIYYTDYATNITLGIEYEDAIDYGEDVLFMVDYIYAIVAGDAEEYNKFFSDAYYKKNEPKDKFTMQKLYEVNISKVSVTQVTDKSGNTHNEYQYIVKYRILDNNGTFRDDFNTGTKEQYIFFTNETGEFLIDSISTPKIKP